MGRRMAEHDGTAETRHAVQSYSGAPPRATIALSIARRAWSTFFSSAERVGVAVLGRGAQAVVGEVAQVGLDRPQPLDDGFGVTHRWLRRVEGSGARASASSSAGWRTVSPPPRGASRTRGWRRRRRAATSASRCAARSASDLAVADLTPRARARAPSTRRRRRSTARRRRSRPAGRRARARCAPRPAACCTWRRWHGSCTTTVAPVSRSGGGSCAATHSEKSTHPAANACAAGVPSRRP